MSYYATIRESSLELTDIAGLYNELGGKGDINIRELIRLLDKEIGFEWGEVYDDKFISCSGGGNYYDYAWEQIAPYMTGFIEWNGEDCTIWRDEFNGGKMYTAYPTLYYVAGDAEQTIYYMARHAEAILRCGSRPHIPDEDLCDMIILWAKEYCSESRTESIEKYLEQKYMEKGWL